MKTKEQISNRLKVLYKKTKELERKKVSFQNKFPNTVNPYDMQLVEINNDVSLLRWVLKH